MTEFGHNAVIAHGVCIDGWGSGPFVIEVAGKRWRFEDSDRFGPSLISKRGDILANPWPSERSPFWRAHRIWRRQGRQVSDDGITCLWTEPRPEKILRLSARVVIVIETGEEDGRMIDATPDEVAAWRARKQASGTGAGGEGG